jgi:hypothetical protein
VSVTVTIDNFVRAETDAMFAGLIPALGGQGVFHHDRALAPLDTQPVVRQNRDTLYSIVIADISGGATLTIPEVGDRYISVMVINQDHYVNRVFHSGGSYPLTVEEFDTEYVMVATRILFDPNSDDDIAEVHRLQDGLSITTDANRPFVPGDWDQPTRQEIHDALLVLGRTMSGLTGSFGRRGEVDPVHHLVSTATAWGGLPDSEAHYINVYPRLPQGRFTMTFRDVPADAFWSLSVYNAAGYFEPGPSEITNINSVFALKNDDGSVTVRLGAEGEPNGIPLPEGWNLLIRLYRPRRDDLATWTVPEITPA